MNEMLTSTLASSLISSIGSDRRLRTFACKVQLFFVQKRDKSGFADFDLLLRPQSRRLAMHSISHDNHLHRQHSRFARDVRRPQCTKMSQLYCRKHLERHHAIGMVRDDRTRPRLIRFANGIAICVPKDRSQQLSARRRYERCWLEWLRMGFRLLILHSILIARILTYQQQWLELLLARLFWSTDVHHQLVLAQVLSLAMRRSPICKRGLMLGWPFVRTVFRYNSLGRMMVRRTANRCVQQCTLVSVRRQRQLVPGRVARLNEHKRSCCTTVSEPMNRIRNLVSSNQRWPATIPTEKSQSIHWMRLRPKLR